MSKEYNLIEVVRTLLKWKWHILSLTILGAISAIVVTLFVMKPYYQSFALVYPTNQSAADRSALFSFEGNSTGESTFYGTKHDANRILSIANSSLLVNYVIKEYDLVNHYENQDKEFANSDTYEEFMKNYSVYKTDKDAIRINLIDTDKDLAAKIVNDIVGTIEFETSKPIKANKKKLYETFQKKEVEKKAALKQVSETLKNTKQGTIDYTLVKEEYESVKESFVEIKKLKEQYQIASEQEMPGIQVIEKAYPAERKIKPVRSKIVIATTLITFFFAMIGALFIEEVKYIKEQL
jgi:capsular polysaccharide biosynthesis protein